MKIMKNILKITMLFILLAGFTSCSNDDDQVYNDTTLEANYINVAGTWMLTEWLGEPLQEGRLCYLELNRRERTFVMYDNSGSMTMRKLSGSFSISKDENDTSIDLISGSYDYGMGDWRNVYRLKVYENKMVWTVQDDLTDISVYERCNEIPEDVINSATGGVN